MKSIMLYICAINRFFNRIFYIRKTVTSLHLQPTHQSKITKVPRVYANFRI